MPSLQSLDRTTRSLLRRALLTERQRREDLEEERRRQSGPGGLIHFIRYFWDVLEPNTPLVEGWPLEAICRHLEAVSFGHIIRLLMTVCPGFMKSLVTDVFWPAWEWSAIDMPATRYVAFSYASTLTERDNGRFRDLVMSAKFQELWGHRFELRKIGEQKVSNNKTGWKLASSVGGVGTGERGDRILIDDAHNVKESESDIVREETVRWFRESISNRLNNAKSAIVVIMQRVHEEDVAGVIIGSNLGYTHLMIPMEYEIGRHCITAIGWEDPRGLDDEGESLFVLADDGMAIPRDEEAQVIIEERQSELAWPARFPDEMVAAFKRDMGPYAFASQYQQSPVPRGGAIIRREWWQLWEPPDGKWPPFEFLLASVDGAYTAKQENDPSACTVWGIFKNEDGLMSAMLVKAWRKFLPLHGTTIERGERETYAQYRRRAEPEWGLIEWVAETCQFRDSKGVVIGSVDKLIIEGKATGISAAQEIQRLYGDEKWTTELIEPSGDKVVRAHAVVPLFAAGLVYAPDREWAEMVISEMETFPKGRYDDLTDSSTQALRYMRVNGLLRQREEVMAEDRRRSAHRGQRKALYPV